MTERKYTPTKWGKVTGLVVCDPDGWRRDGKSFDEPVTYDEFVERATTSTVQNITAFWSYTMSQAFDKYSAKRGRLSGRLSERDPSEQVIPRTPTVTRGCTTCWGLGWIVEGRTYNWPYGEQVQCPNPECTA